MLFKFFEMHLYVCMCVTNIYILYTFNMHSLVVNKVQRSNIFPQWPILYLFSESVQKFTHILLLDWSFLERQKHHIHISASAVWFTNKWLLWVKMYLILYQILPWICPNLFETNQIKM